MKLYITESHIGISMVISNGLYHIWGVDNNFYVWIWPVPVDFIWLGQMRSLFPICFSMNTITNFTNVGHFQLYGY